APPAVAPVAAAAPNPGVGGGDGGATPRGGGGGVLSGWWGVATVEGDAGTGGAAAPVAVPAARGAEYWKAEGGSAENASLRISALALCTRVDGFGRFNRVE